VEFAACSLVCQFQSGHRDFPLTTLGNGLNVLKVMPESAIKFGSYEAAKRALAQLEGHNDPQKINPYSKFVAGGIGGMVSQYVTFFARIQLLTYTDLWFTLLILSNFGTTPHDQLDDS